MFPYSLDTCRGDSRDGDKPSGRSAYTSNYANLGRRFRLHLPLPPAPHFCRARCSWVDGGYLGARLLYGSLPPSSSSLSLLSSLSSPSFNPHYPHGLPLSLCHLSLPPSLSLSVSFFLLFVPLSPSLFLFLSLSSPPGGVLL
jgi:hypothetical protein